MNPIISVIIPVYNPGRHLIKCLDSIINQTYPYLQIILIDDGSTDGSGEICDQYAEKDSRVICVHQPNSGVSKARNKGIELANGDYYHFPDSDDYIEPDTYEYLLNLMYEHKCEAVSFEFFGTYSDHETQNILPDDFYGLFDITNAHRLIMTGTPFAWNKLFKKELIIANSNLPGIKFHEDIFRGEDSLFVHEAIERAQTMWFDKRPLYHYVQSEESAVRGRFRVSQLSALKLFEAYEPLHRKYPELEQYFYKSMSHLMIMLYYDMWADEADYSEKQRELYGRFKKNKKVMYQNCSVSRSEKVKFSLFSFSPKLFCIVHKKMHHL